MCNSRKPKQTGGKSTAPVENSTPQTPINSQSTNDSVSKRLQPLHTMGCDRDGVPTIQPEVVSEDEERNVRLESMGTKQDRSANEDWQQFQHHLESLRELHRRNFRPDSSGLTESQWSDLAGEYEELKYFADLRWQRLREELEQGRREFNEFTDHAAKAIGEQSSSTDS